MSCRLRKHYQVCCYLTFVSLSWMDVDVHTVFLGAFSCVHDHFEDTPISFSFSLTHTHTSPPAIVLWFLLFVFLLLHFLVGGPVVPSQFWYIGGLFALSFVVAMIVIIRRQKQQGYREVRSQESLSLNQKRGSDGHQQPRGYTIPESQQSGNYALPKNNNQHTWLMVDNRMM